MSGKPRILPAERITMMLRSKWFAIRSPEGWLNTSLDSWQSDVNWRWEGTAQQKDNVLKMFPEYADSPFEIVEITLEVKRRLQVARSTKRGQG